MARMIGAVPTRSNHIRTHAPAPGKTHAGRYNLTVKGVQDADFHR